MNAAEARIAEVLPDAFDNADQRTEVDGQTGVVPQGQRNDHLARRAGVMRQKGFTVEAIAAALQVVNRQQCQPPLKDSEVNQIARSVGRYAPDATHQADRRSIRLTPASSMRVRPVHWLWKNRLPLGTLALMGGREGIGKTICAYTMAADLTQGRMDGIYAGIPKAVIVAATEDSWEHTIVPRLMAAGADLGRVYRVDVVTSVGTDATLSLPRDLCELRSATQDVDAALVILDPLLSRLDANLDTHKDAEVRIALEPLSALADVCGVCVLGLIHVNKSTSSDVLTTLMASRAFAAVARAVLFVMQDPDDEKIRLLGQGKNNLGQMDLPTLAFRIGGVKVAETEEGDVWTGKLEWLGETDRTIKQAVEAAAISAGDRSATSEAGDWLQDYVQSEGGTADFADIKREGAKAGHSKDSLRRAKTKLGITSITCGFPRRAIWKLATTPSVDATAGETSATAHTASTASTGAQWAQCAQSAQCAEGPQELASTGSTAFDKAVDR